MGKKTVKFLPFPIAALSNRVPESGRVGALMVENIKHARRTERDLLKLVIPVAKFDGSECHCNPFGTHPEYKSHFSELESS